MEMRKDVPSQLKIVSIHTNKLQGLELHVPRQEFWWTKAPGEGVVGGGEGSQEIVYGGGGHVL